MKSLFSKVSNAIGIRIRSWEEVRYSNEPANLLPDPPVRARLLNFVLQVKKRRVCYWANPQTHTHARARASAMNRHKLSQTGGLYEREKYTL